MPGGGLQVWDGQRVVQDPRLRVSDTSLVPQARAPRGPVLCHVMQCDRRVGEVLLLSFGEGSPLARVWQSQCSEPLRSRLSPEELGPLQGMLMQQPGLPTARIVQCRAVPCSAVQRAALSRVTGSFEVGRQTLLQAHAAGSVNPRASGPPP